MNRPRIAAGELLALTQEDVVLTGHSIEARVYAEDPRTGFLPTGGHVDAVRHPAGDGIRVDTALADGLDVSIDYDLMLAKIIATGPDRDEARRRLVTALADTAVFGFTTNVEFPRLLLELPDVAAGRLDTGLIARELDGLRFAEASDRVYAEAALLLAGEDAAHAPEGVWGPGRDRLAPRCPGGEHVSPVRRRRRRTGRHGAPRVRTRSSRSRVLRRSPGGWSHLPGVRRRSGVDGSSRRFPAHVGGEGAALLIGVDGARCSPCASTGPCTTAREGAD